MGNSYIIPLKEFKLRLQMSSRNFLFVGCTVAVTASVLNKQQFSYTCAFSENMVHTSMHKVYVYCFHF